MRVSNEQFFQNLNQLNQVLQQPDQQAVKDDVKKFTQTMGTGGVTQFVDSFESISANNKDLLHGLLTGQSTNSYDNLGAVQGYVEQELQSQVQQRMTQSHLRGMNRLDPTDIQTNQEAHIDGDPQRFSEKFSEIKLTAEHQRARLLDKLTITSQAQEDRPLGNRLNILDSTVTSQPPGGPIRRAMDEAAVLTHTGSPSGRLNIEEHDLTVTSQPPGGPIRRAMDEAVVLTDTIPSGGRLNIKEYDLTETSQPPGGPIRRAMDEAAVVSDTLSPGGRLNAGEIDQTVTSTRATQRSSQAMDENSVVTDTKPSNG